jgi:hypothetical protein
MPAAHLAENQGAGMSDFASPEERQQQQIADWLLAILRFAVTRQEPDRMSALTMANDMDRPSAHAESNSFAFFANTTKELCDVIANEHTPQRLRVLRQHLGRIGNRRLRAAIEAATGLQERGTAATAHPESVRAYLWKGL